MNKKINVILTLLLIMGASNVHAYRAIYFNRAATLPRGKLTMRAYYLKPIFNSMYDNTTNQMVALPSTTNLNFNTINFFMSYGLFDWLTVGLNSLYVSKEITSPLITKKATGLGDISNMFKLSILKKKKMFFSLAVLVKWDNAKYKTSAPTEFPLGSGTIDVSIKPLLDIKVSKMWIYIIPTYTISGKNETLDKGDVLSFVTTISFPAPIINRFFGELSVNFQYKFKDKDNNGVTIPHSETYIFSISPGLQYGITKKLYIQSLSEIVIKTKDTFGKSAIFKTGLSYKF